ncbi:MAG: DUF1489 family protein [Halocynthiibacter sp.]
MAQFINLVKLSVGSESVDTLMAWQESRKATTPDGNPRHVTRMWPKREAELISGGSIYWVIKGVILARQTVLRLDEVIGDDGIRRCAIVLDPDVIRTEPAPRRAFQGWRYLQPDDSPADLTESKGVEDDLPVHLSSALADIGVR